MPPVDPVTGQPVVNPFQVEPAPEGDNPLPNGPNPLDALRNRANRVRGQNQWANIDGAARNWRTSNPRAIYNAPSADLLGAAEQALAGSTLRDDDEKLAGLDGNKKNLRKLFHAFWNNDQRGVQFFSIQEMEAMRQWGLKNYGPNGMAQFQQDFNELFGQSVQQDTRFNLDLIARQWSQNAGSSDFVGNGANGDNGFRSLFNSLGTNLANRMVQTHGLQRAQELMNFDGQGEYNTFDNIRLMLDGNNNPVFQGLTTHNPQDNPQNRARRITYLFGAQGLPNQGQNPQGGAQGVGQQQQGGANPGFGAPQRRSPAGTVISNLLD